MSTGPNTQPSADAESTPKLLSLATAAARLDVPEGRLLRWIKEGRLPHIRLTHKTIGVAEDDLAAFIATLRVEATAPPPKPRNAPKSAAHRAAIARGRKAYWDRVRAEKDAAAKAGGK